MGLSESGEGCRISCGAGPGTGRISSAIAHIKLTCCRGGVSSTVLKTHAVTPVTCQSPCCGWDLCARGGRAVSCRVGSRRGGGLVLPRLFFRLLREFGCSGRGIHRQAQEAVADRAVPGQMPIRRRGGQVCAEQGPRLVPDRCRHTPPPGSVGNGGLVSGYRGLEAPSRWRGGCRAHLRRCGDRPGGCRPQPPASALNGPRPQTPDGLRCLGLRTQRRRPAPRCRDAGLTSYCGPDGI